jgi:hypothetical protein
MKPTMKIEAMMAVRSTFTKVLGANIFLIGALRQYYARIMPEKRITKKRSYLGIEFYMLALHTLNIRRGKRKNYYFISISLFITNL